MSVYDLYKPLRNELRKYAILPALRVIWAWMQHLQFGSSIPSDIEVPWSIQAAPTGPRKGIYEWELALLAKEIILNSAPNASADLRYWRHFSGLVNHVKNLAAQSFDQDYVYTFNPLQQYPLLRCRAVGKTVLVAPIPTYLIKRFTEGVYYEIVDSPGFNKSLELRSNSTLEKFWTRSPILGSPPWLRRSTSAVRVEKTLSIGSRAMKPESYSSNARPRGFDMKLKLLFLI